VFPIAIALLTCLPGSSSKSKQSHIESGEDKPNIHYKQINESVLIIIFLFSPIKRWVNLKCSKTIKQGKKTEWTNVNVSHDNYE